MRTRTSNRTKSFTLEKYDFDASSEEENGEPSTPKRRKNAEEDDDNFDEGPAAADVESPDEELAADSEGDASDAEVDSRDKFYRQNVRRIQPFNLRAVDAPIAYLAVEPMPPEGYQGKAYVGPFDRNFRGQPLTKAWYGPLRSTVQTAHKLLDRWMHWTVLPPKIKDHELNDRGVWAPDWEEKEAYFSQKLLERLTESEQRLAPPAVLSPEDAEPYQSPARSMPVLMGPYQSQREVTFEAGDALAVSQAGISFDEDESDAKIPTGWILDTGGIPLALDWRRGSDSAQVLAVAVIPHVDQEAYNYEEESEKPDFKKHGMVQLWEFSGDSPDEGGFIRPSTTRPRLQKILCFDHGRARRVKWSPSLAHLAILCGDGRVCVVEPGDGDGHYEKLVQPVSLVLVDETDVKATTMAWVALNRLAVGYSDGSIALWSIHPTHLLSRHPVHHSDVVDIASGYPTMPYIVASTPIGGNTKLIDLQAPSYETTEVQTATVSTQPNNLAYSDHLLGFFSMYPSSSPLNTIVGFLHHSTFPIFRRVFTGECAVTCLSVGRTHPFLLVGASDGSLWATNPQIELFSSRRDPSDRLRVFQHEHRPANLFPEDSPASQRGASRLIHGFKIDKNRNKSDAKAAPKKVKPHKKVSGQPAAEEDEAAAFVDLSRAVVHESLTRVSVIEWNPNEGYGCWAAVAMGSGLVRVIDLGLEQPRESA